MLKLRSRHLSRRSPVRLVSGTMPNTKSREGCQHIHPSTHPRSERHFQLGPGHRLQKSTISEANSDPKSKPVSKRPESGSPSKMTPKPAPRSKEEAAILYMMRTHRAQLPQWKQIGYAVHKWLIVSIEHWLSQIIAAITDHSSLTAGLGTSMTPTLDPKDSWTGKIYCLRSRITTHSDIKRGMLVFVRYVEYWSSCDWAIISDQDIQETPHNMAVSSESGSLGSQATWCGPGVTVPTILSCKSHRAITG